MDERGLSFTEAEYDLAERLGKPILAFLHRDPDAIPAGKVERTDSAQQKLDAFRKRVLKSRTCKTWTTPDDLKAVVMASLIQAFRSNPQRGWLRGGGPDVTETLARLADLQQRHDELTRENDALRGQVGAPISRDLAGGDELVEIDFRYTIDQKDKRHSVKLSWSTLFFGIAEELMTECERHTIEGALTGVIVTEIWQTPLSDEMTREKPPADRSEFWRRTHITDDSFMLVILQFMALGLVETSSVMRTRNMPSGFREFQNQEYQEQVWKLTRRGIIEFLGKRVRKSAARAEA